MIRLAGLARSRAVLASTTVRGSPVLSLCRAYALEANPEGTKPVKPAAPAKPATPTTSATPTTPPKPEVAAPTPQPAIPPPPKKRRFGFFTRIIFFSSVLTVGFYAGSTWFALKNDRWHDFFVESVPLGETIMDYFDEWQLRAAADRLGGEFRRVTTDGSWPPTSPPPSPPPSVAEQKAAPDAHGDAKDGDLSAKAAALKELAERKTQSLADHVQSDVSYLKDLAQKEIDRVLGASTSLGTRPKEGDSKPEGVLSRAAHRVADGVSSVMHTHPKFSDLDTEELVRKAEAALRGRPALPPSKPTERKSSPTSPAPPQTGEPPLHHQTPTAGLQPPTGVSSDAAPPAPPAKEGKKGDGKPIYTGRLPLGFEPPPGYSLPPKPKDSGSPPTTPAPPKNPEAPSGPETLPLLSSSLKPELTSAEPVIAQLASTIDSLSSYLVSTSNPTALNGARSVIETAQIDIQQLAERIEKVKDEERQALEKRMEQAKDEWEGKLRSLEKEAQEKFDKQEDGWKTAFEQEKSQLVDGYKEKLKAELTTQGEIINQRLREEVVAQGIELQRRWIRDIKMHVEQERGQRLAKLDKLSMDFKELERLTLDNSAYLQENLRLHAFWASIRALQSAIESPVRRPFRNELRVLRSLATARDDPVVTAALDSLDATDIPDVGVEPYSDLATWFTTTVYPCVAEVALVPDENAGVLAHVASSVLSKFRFRRQGLVDGNDVLSTLARAEFYVSEKDLENAARELNQLKGTAKVLLTDWLEAARRRLEAQQVLEVVSAEATLASLLVV